jgi:hypothetical protein
VQTTLELAKARQQEMLEFAAHNREAQRARVHDRMRRRADRADRQLVDTWYRATELRARLAELELANQ